MASVCGFDHTLTAAAASRVEGRKAAVDLRRQYREAGDSRVARLVCLASRVWERDLERR